MNAAMSKWVRLSLAAIALLLLSSCWSAKEIDEMRYAHTIGIDYEDGKYIVYVQMVNFFSPSNADGQKGSQPSVVVNVERQEGETIVEAIHNIYHVSQRRIYWGHVTALILGEGLVRHRDMDDVFDAFSRSHDIRYTIWIYVAKSSMHKLLTTLPISEQPVILSKIGNPMENFKQSSYVYPVKFHYFLSRYHEYGRTTNIPVVQVESAAQSEASSPQNTILIYAFSIFQDLEYKGTIYKDEGNGLRWVQNKSVRAPLDVQTEHRPGRSQTISLIMNKIHASVHYTPGGKGKYKIRIRAGGQLIDSEEDVPVDHIESLAKAKIREEVMTTYKAAYAMGADVYSLQYEVYRKHPRLWRQLKKEGGLLPAPEDLEVEVRAFVKSTGSLRSGLKKTVFE